MEREDKLADDLRFVRSPGLLRTRNLLSPAATASLVIAREIVNLAENNRCPA